MRSELILPTRFGDCGFIIPLRGEIRCSKGRLGVGELLHFVSDGNSVAMASQEARVAFIMGTPLKEPVVSLGPFAMSDRLRNKVVAQSYRSGGVGSILS